MDFNNIGYTRKRQFLVYKAPDIDIEGNNIVFASLPKRDIDGTIYYNSGEMFNLYEEFKDNDSHIFIDFNNVINNKNLDNGIKEFIKKYGYLYRDKKILTIYYNLRKGQAKTMIHKINKNTFINELYIFICVQDLYNIISRYKTKTKNNITLPPLKNWNLAFNKVIDYYQRKYNKPKTEIQNMFPNLEKEIVLTYEIYEKILDMYTIILNCYLENITVKAMTYEKNELITCLTSENLIDAIYLDYFEYISNKGINREIRQCKECGKLFYIDKSNKNQVRKIYCDTKCAKKHSVKKSNDRLEYKLYRKYYLQNYNWYNKKKITYDKFANWQEDALILKNKFENKELTYKIYENKMNELQENLLKEGVMNGSIRKDKK